ncbi:zinc finger protein 761-like protein [Leptotrombidium deliense]|uniref:Zinc finger protein 761-like protein n=1 Tax=Leptotrombidium deliense TaxID=299467 RepID=A0A443S4Y9_9ACAR|nr:zinc finger protein 761-like protein [Leptotrombidium deliense]
MAGTDYEFNAKLVKRVTDWLIGYNIFYVEWENEFLSLEELSDCKDIVRKFHRSKNWEIPRWKGDPLPKPKNRYPMTGKRRRKPKKNSKALQAEIDFIRQQHLQQQPEQQPQAIEQHQQQTEQAEQQQPEQIEEQQQQQQQLQQLEPQQQQRKQHQPTDLLLQLLNPQRKEQHTQAEQQLQIVPEPRKDFEVDSIVNLYPKESFDDSEHDLYEVVWKSCWVHANDLHMCKHRAIRDFFNTERGILMKTNESLLRQIPDFSLNMDNWRTAAFHSERADKQDAPDYSRFKGLSEEEREKVYAREVFNENLRLKNYIDNGFCEPSTSSITDSSLLAIESPSTVRSTNSVDATNVMAIEYYTAVSDDQTKVNDNHTCEDAFNINDETVIDEVLNETTANGTSQHQENESETSENLVNSNFCFVENYNPFSHENNIEVVDSITESINVVVDKYTLAFNNSQKLRSVSTTTVEIATESEDDCIILDSEKNRVALPSRFKCEDCEKQFDKKSSLRKHQESHKERIACDQCSKTFSIRDNLRRHKETHTKKLKCRLCKAGPFSCVYALNRHSHTHKNDRYECDCGSSFNRLDNLKKHQKKLNHN